MEIFFNGNEGIIYPPPPPSCSITLCFTVADAGPDAIDGEWGLWSPFAPCTVTCGGGEHARIRLCSDPEPQFGGENCEGDDTEVEECGEEPCDGKTIIAVVVYSLRGKSDSRIRRGTVCR